MANPNALNRRQYQLLKMLDSGTPLLDAQQQMRVSAQALKRWLNRPAFLRRIEAAVVVLRTHREMALHTAAHRAAKLLAGAVTGEKRLSAARQRACVELIKFARQSSIRRADSAAASPAQSTAHPTLSDEDARALLAELSV